MTDYTVAEEGEISKGERRLVELEGKEIGVFNIDGEYYAYINWCAHQAGPCAEGSVTGTRTADYDSEDLDTQLSYIKEGEILNCPWHGWEYDITSGDCLSRGDVKLPSYPVEIVDGEIVVTL